MGVLYHFCAHSSATDLKMFSSKQKFVVFKDLL